MIEMACLGNKVWRPALVLFLQISEGYAGLITSQRYEQPIGMAPPNRGALIVIEGLDRAGKSTQCSLLSEQLGSTGRQVKSIRFPSK